MARDLTDSGFAVVSIDIRHDKVNQGSSVDLPCQLVPAFSPQYLYNEVSDVKQAILAARNPSPTSILHGKVNHKVGAVGGSGGGAHVAWCAATGASGQDKLDAGVSLSGAYKFDDKRSLEDTAGEDGMGFCTNVTVYCQVAIPREGCGALDDNAELMAGSPIYKIDESGLNTAPLFAFATNEDFMPGEQFEAIDTSLSDLDGGGKYKTLEFSDPINKHSFAYWFDRTGADDCTKVCALAKRFLATQLGISSTNCPTCTHEN